MAIEFTDQQKKVITHDHTKHGVVRAGPGTGKSATVVELAHRLCRDNPEVRLKFLTFTRAATSELAKKISSGEEGLGIKPSTIHSFAISILMKNQDALPIQLPLRIPSEYETKKIIFPYIGKLINKRVTRVDKLVHAMASMWESLDPDFTLQDITPEEKSKFLSAFNRATRIFGFTLLNQLPDLLRRLLNDHSDVKGLDFDFMIIDEYQDLNKCEIELLKLLSSKGIKILAVGDEDQSIYSFREAHPAGIREFENYFAEAVPYDLSICHRCPSNLLGWAQHVIQGDLGRSSRPFPESKSTVDAEIKLLHFAREVSEAQGIADLIIKFIQKNIKPHEILILTRSDDNEKFTKKIKEILKDKSVATFDSRDLKKMLKTKEVVKLMAFLQMMENKKDSLGWITLLKETRGIGNTTIGKILKRAEEENKRFDSVVESESGDLGSHPVFCRIKEQLETVRVEYEKIDPQNTKLGEWIATTVAPKLEIDLSTEFVNILREVDARVEVENQTLGYFISQISPISQDIANEQEIGVRFMTMQGSKGLTSRATIILGVDNDLIPSSRNPKQDEERRLLYVAMTRSQEILIMTWANRRRGPQARSGTPNILRRNYSSFLEGGPIQSEEGTSYVSSFS